MSDPAAISSQPTHTGAPYCSSWAAEQCLSEGLRRMIARARTPGEEGLWRWANEISNRGVPCQVRVITFHRRAAAHTRGLDAEVEIIRIHFHGHWWNEHGDYFPTLDGLLDVLAGAGQWHGAEWANFPLGEPAPLGLGYTAPQDTERQAQISAEIDQALLAATTPAAANPNGSGRRI